MLSNPIYVGKIKHRDKIHDGEHQSIIADDVFKAVQAKLADQAPCERGTSVQRDIHLLNGLLYDETGDRLAPIHANKNGKRYRYYISSRLKEDGSDNASAWRIPSRDIEAIVIQQLRTLFSDKPLLSRWLEEAGHTVATETALTRAAAAVRCIEDAQPHRVREIVRMAVHRVELSRGQLQLTIDKTNVINWLIGRALSAVGSNTDFDGHLIDVPFAVRKRGVEQRLVVEGREPASRFIDQSLIDTIARGARLSRRADQGRGEERNRDAI